MAIILQKYISLDKPDSLGPDKCSETSIAETMCDYILHLFSFLKKVVSSFHTQDTGVSSHVTDLSDKQATKRKNEKGQKQN